MWLISLLKEKPECCPTIVKMVSFDTTSLWGIMWPLKTMFTVTPGEMFMLPC